MLDSPVRIFRCPICIENGFNAPRQDLSLLIEHLAKHYQFYLYECRECKAQFATPFLANFHIKEGRCKNEDGEMRADEKRPLIAVNLNDIEFSSFCTLQNAITKSTKDMLLEQKVTTAKSRRRESFGVGTKARLPPETKNRDWSIPTPQSPTSPEGSRTAEQQILWLSKERTNGERTTSINMKNSHISPSSSSSLSRAGPEFSEDDPGIRLALKAEIESNFGEAPRRRYFHASPFNYRRSYVHREYRGFKI